MVSATTRDSFECRPFVNSINNSPIPIPPYLHPLHNPTTYPFSFRMSTITTSKIKMTKSSIKWKWSYNTRSRRHVWTRWLCDHPLPSPPCALSTVGSVASKRYARTARRRVRIHRHDDWLHRATSVTSTVFTLGALCFFLVLTAEVRSLYKWVLSPGMLMRFFGTLTSFVPIADTFEQKNGWITFRMDTLIFLSPPRWQPGMLPNVYMNARRLTRVNVLTIITNAMRNNYTFI